MAKCYLNIIYQEESWSGDLFNCELGYHDEHIRGVGVPRKLSDDLDGVNDLADLFRGAPRVCDLYHAQTRVRDDQVIGKAMCVSVVDLTYMW